MITALAIRPVSAPLAPFGLILDLVAIDQALIAMEDGHAADRDLDAAIYEALGWQVERAGRRRRRIGWWARSPLSTGWMPLPSPTGDRNAAASLVPHRWDFGSGVRATGAFGWVRERRARAGRTGPEFFELNRLTEPRALASAALHAHRFIARAGAPEVVHG